MNRHDRIVSNIIIVILLAFGATAIMRWETTVVLLSNYFFTDEAEVYSREAILLAALHEGTSTPSALATSRFEVLLGKLARKCDTESKSAIARALIETQRAITAHGRSSSLLKLGNVLYRQIPDKAVKGTTCEETAYALSLYSTL